MMQRDALRRVRWLYHFTDSRNIPAIWELGGLWSTAKLREMGVEFYPGGNEHSLSADRMFGMDQYVHLCFTTEHPMAYICQQDGRIEKLQWIYIDDPAGLFQIDGVQYCAEVANKSGAQLCSIEEARELFDDVALYDYLDWNVGDHYARRVAAEKCEILIPDHLPLKYFEERLPKGLNG
jgi:ssDNA thymidine ADP-ribosyltransferase, DarT